MAREKKKLTNFVRKLLREFDGKYYTNDDQHKSDWSVIPEIIQALYDGVKGYVISVGPSEGGGYRTSSDGLSKWKEYDLQLNKSDDMDFYIQGKIILSAAGTVEDPFHRYDVTIILQ